MKFPNSGPEVFAIMIKFMVTVLRAGTFLLSINSYNNSFFLFCFSFTPFEISPKYAFIRQVLHVPGW